MSTTPAAAAPIKPLAMRDAFLARVHAEMNSHPELFFVSADFGSPVLDRIRGEFPDRFINVGVAEQNLINVSAGLALEGYTVFAYAIAPFITMRCYEQIRVSLALLSTIRPMNVNLVGVGAGYSYVVSGPTHQCYEDITVMRALPSVQVMSPADHVTAAALADRCIGTTGPKYLRFDAQVLPVIYTEGAPDIARGFHVHRRGKHVALVATGYMVHTARQVAETLAANGISTGVIDLFDLRDFAADALQAELAGYDRVVTMEEGFRGRGGVDALVGEFLSRRGLRKPMLNVGVEPAYTWELGSRTELHERVGIGAEAVVKAVRAFAGRPVGEAVV
jgi:transketolase